MALSVRIVFALVLTVAATKSVFGGIGWWSLGVSECSLGSKAPCETCAKLTKNYNLTRDQKEACIQDPSQVQAIARGTRKAIIDCQAVFSERKWNCSTFSGENLFGRFVTESRTRETAVLFAFLSAGAIQEVAEACHEQRLLNCPCLRGFLVNTTANGDTIFSDCAANFEWAANFFSSFVTSVYEQLDLVGVKSDLHNVNAGILSVKKIRKSCNCHGISGTCTVQTCYDQVISVSEVRDSLAISYNGATKVELVNGELQRIPIPGANPDNINENNLVFLDNTPDLCKTDLAKGILGTAHRLCKEEPGLLDCANLCCGRGFYTVTYTVPIEECRFVWCCRIDCAVTGSKTIVERRCNP